MKIAVETLSGQKLVGDLVHVDYLTNSMNQLFGNGIWIKREKHITFLSETEVKAMRLAKKHESEEQ